MRLQRRHIHHLEVLGQSAPLQAVEVECSDIERLSGALESLLADPARARDMGARGRDRLLPTFSFKQFQSRLKQVLSDVLDR